MDAEPTKAELKILRYVILETLNILVPSNKRLNKMRRQEVLLGNVRASKRQTYSPAHSMYVVTTNIDLEKIIDENTSENFKQNRSSPNTS